MLKSVNAYSPAGLYPDLWIDRYDDGVKVNIYTQHADFIPLVGHLPEGDSVSVYHMIRGEDGSSENFLASHARVYAGAEYVTMLKLSPSLENKRFLRRIITPLHRKISY